MQYFISQNVKSVVIACGTASSLAYPLLKENYNIPIFDIITPIAKEINDNNIGIIATKGSVNSHVWEKKIHEFHPNANIYTRACPKLVPIAENNLTNTWFAKRVLKKYLKDFKPYSIDSIILGCTHYPLFYDTIHQEFGNSVKIWNIGTVSAKLFANYLNQNNLMSSNKKGSIQYICSGNQKKFLKKISRINK